MLVRVSYGEDIVAATTGEETMIVSTDPISFAAERTGTLGVVIASNDVAVCGGVPEWLVNIVLLPELDVNLLGDITAQLDAEARRLDISIVGSHTETVARLSRPLFSLTCMDLTGRYVPMSGAESGDTVTLTKGTGVEGMAVLATDSRTNLGATSVEPAATDHAVGFFDDVSVLPESAVLALAATAMHDPTEGDVLNRLVELACASGVRIKVDGDDVSVRPETWTLCGAMGVDPM